jgi:23S rRNA pseudouridine1911/1915/1917 synthase
MNFQKTVVDSKSAGARLDLFLTRCLANPKNSQEFSRSEIQKLIAEGQITLNGKSARASARVKSNDLVVVRTLPPKSPGLVAEPIALDVIHQDDDCIVINKAAGMVVHPAAGTNTGTLVNAILYHCPDLQGIGGESRPGIVHRLDKDTSGVMIVAKNAAAFHQLARQFKERQVKKEYLAVVLGKPKDRHGIIDRPIGRHRSDRKRMSSLHALAKKREAITEWVVEKSFRRKEEAPSASWVSLLRLVPKTGRTHQIRVHLADMGHPLVGDKVYGRKRPNPTAKSGGVSGSDSFPRQALHAERLSLFHPRTGDLMEFYAPLAQDIQSLLQALEDEI